MTQSFFWLLVGCLLFWGNSGEFCFIIIALLREVLITRKPSWTRLSLSLKRIQKPKKPVITLFWHYLLRVALRVFKRCFCHVYHLVKAPNLYFMQRFCFIRHNVYRGANFFHYAQGWIQKIQKEGAESPTLPLTEKTSLPPDCLIITTLEKRLEALGLYKNVLKTQEKRGPRPPWPLP